MSTKPSNPSRRDFLKLAGATLASLNTAACMRKPQEKILPFATRPEDLVPGQPRYFATSWNVGNSVQGLVVRSTDGRPTKIEGNKNHPLSRGATNAWAQASVLEIYSPERSRSAVHDGQPAGVEDVNAMLAALPATLEKTGGEGLAMLLAEHPSPTLDRLLDELRAKYPKAVFYLHDGAGEDNARAGAALVGIRDVVWSGGGPPRVIAAFDADPLGTEGDVVAFSRMYADGRPERSATPNRLYAVEPHLTITGGNADHRLAAKGGAVAEILAAVAMRLRESGLDLPALPVRAEELARPFVAALAEDLLASRGKSWVIAGERQPPPVHALTFLINYALGNFGETIKLVTRKRAAYESLAALAERLRAGAVQQLIIIGGNAAFDAPGNLAIDSLLTAAPLSIHLGLQRDETGSRSKWHIPRSHYLEAWGDLIARDGTVSIQQPLIAPLYESLSEIELVARLLGRAEAGYALVRETHRALAPTDFEKSWERWLHDGVVSDARPEYSSAAPSSAAFPAAWKIPPQSEGLELNFIRDASVLDGRFACSPWLQELPDPITKLTWDNAALIGPETAKKLGVASGMMVRVTHHQIEITIPVWVQPGTADDVVVLPLGYGRTESGKFAKSGFAVGSMRLEQSPHILAGATLAKTAGTHRLACTQLETSTHGRSMIRSTTAPEFAEEPNFVEKFEIMSPDRLRSLWEEPNPKDGHQWGMTIDLNACTSCNACTVACQAENNIPWVGKEDVLVGREMHWIRVDRYFDETPNHELEFKTQPLGCAHCETAPCENVCPVQATAHSPEGLNDMAYNRCIGTRYCANNCPYKVRRFNFRNYADQNDQDYGLGIAMQRNPDVTVRFRGVMEKCTYCVQRINRGRIDAKVNGDGVIKDGAVDPACAQACPTQAITFGNLNDAESRVAKTKANPRNYAVAAELNIRPRTTYLGRISNPNPKLVKG